MLVVDAGWYYFDLRGVRVRGTATADAARTPGDGSVRWWTMHPAKTITWDYGSLRERGTG